MNSNLPNPDNDEVVQLRQQVARYQALLQKLFGDTWDSMTPEELEREISEAKNIDHIIADLERAEAA